MRIAGGINAAKRIFINSFDNSGKLVNKRVIRGAKQYDYLYDTLSKNKGYDCVLITDHSNGSQYLEDAPEKYNWLKTLYKTMFGNTDVKIIENAEGKKTVSCSFVDLNNFYNPETGENIFADFYRGMTGYLNKDVDAEQYRLTRLLTRKNNTQNIDKLNIIGLKQD